MNDSVFEAVETSSRILRLDFSSIGFAKLAEEQDFSEEQIQAVGVVFKHLQNKKVDTTIHTLLKMSRLPLKDPKTFENFDFSVIKGRDANRLKTLPSLSAIYAHRNLAFIGPAGTGKTHLAQAFGYACCQRGIKTYFIKMSELRDKFTAARRFINVPIPSVKDIPISGWILRFHNCFSKQDLLFFYFTAAIAFKSDNTFR